jgi:hypothetical protein
VGDGRPTICTWWNKFDAALVHVTAPNFPGPVQEHVAANSCNRTEATDVSRNCSSSVGQPSRLVFCTATGPCILVQDAKNYMEHLLTRPIGSSGNRRQKRTDTTSGVVVAENNLRVSYFLNNEQVNYFSLVGSCHLSLFGVWYLGGTLEWHAPVYQVGIR